MSTDPDGLRGGAARLKRRRRRSGGGARRRRRTGRCPRRSASTRSRTPSRAEVGGCPRRATCHGLEPAAVMQVQRGGHQAGLVEADTVPWKETVKSSAGSVLLVRYRMIGWPSFAPCRSTSRTKFGWWCVPNSRLKMSMQRCRTTGWPRCALSAPAVRRRRLGSASPQRRRLALDGHGWFLLGTAAVPCARLPVATASCRPIRSTRA